MSTLVPRKKWICTRKAPSIFDARSDLFTHVDAMFDNIHSRLFGDSLSLFDSVQRTSYPKADVYEDDKTVTIEAGIPGLTKEDVKVEYVEDVLTISAQKQETKETRVHRELHKSAFRKSWRFPASLYKVAEIDAEVKDGLLTVSIPKIVEEKEEPRQIEIK
jgi:HSP20 family protein